METGEALDLRGGSTVWSGGRRYPYPLVKLPRSVSTDVLIVGAGITGSFIAERLTRKGRRVVVLDRRGPHRGSTAASTALLQWELDSPMLALEQRRGFEATGRVWHKSRAAVDEIGTLVEALRIPCGFARRDSYYLAGNALDPAGLREELALRRRAGIPGAFIDDAALAKGGIVGEAALAHTGSAEADPVALAAGLLAVAAHRGATVAAPAAAIAFDIGRHRVTVATDRGSVITAAAMVLATGYEMPAFVPATIHSVVSTWAIASAPLPPEKLWPSRALVWEASEPYLYARTSHGARIVAGGEDEPLEDAAARDALISEKTDAIRNHVAALFPAAGPIVAEYAWSGFFGRTEDSLPLIGPVPGSPNCFAAYGYGGNGITFSCLAAGMIERMLDGGHESDDDLFAIDRSA